MSGDTLRLTLVEARALSFRRNPDLTAARLDVDVARGDYRQASVLFRSNPTVEYYAEGRSGSGPEGLIAQEVEVFGQRGARRGAGRAGIERAAAGVENTISIIIIVFLPLFTLQGVEGKMFRPMAFAVSFAMFGSLVFSLTVIPVLCAYFLKGGSEDDTWIMRIVKRPYIPLLRGPWTTERKFLPGRSARWP